MKVSIQATGISAVVETFHGSLVVQLLDSHGHSLAVGRFDNPEPVAAEEPAQEFHWPPQRQSA